MTKDRTRQIYEESRLYPDTTVSRMVNTIGDDYAGRQLRRKLELLSAHVSHGPLVDLCCATSDHLELFADRGTCIGVDFSLPFLRSARERSSAQIEFIAADARALPLASGTVSTLYSFSALYQVPDAERVFAEISRVLRPMGRCVLDLGNARSLNAYCVERYYPELPQSHFLSVGQMRDLCTRHRLRVVERRCFQLLPLWAGRPRWLWPLLHPIWQRILRREIGGRMLDEWISSLPGLRNVAFRHVLVCERC